MPESNTTLAAVMSLLRLNSTPGYVSTPPYPTPPIQITTTGRRTISGSSRIAEAMSVSGPRNAT